MINLIPPQLKKEKAIQKKIGYLSIGLISLLSLIAAATLLMYIYNQFALGTVVNLRSETEATKKGSEQYASVENKINQTNAKLKKLEGIDKKRVLWSNVLTELANTAPAQVQLKNVSFDQETGKVLLTGSAGNRMAIANFKDKLETSNYFKNVFFSSSSLNEATTDYSFSLTAELESIK